MEESWLYAQNWYRIYSLKSIVVDDGVWNEKVVLPSWLVMAKSHWLITSIPISSFACNCWYSEYFFSEFAYSVYGTWYGYAWVRIVCFDDSAEPAMEWSLCVAMVILHAGVCEEFGIGKVFDCVVFECLHFFLAQVIRHLLRCKSTVLSWIMQIKVCYRL